MWLMVMPELVLPNWGSRFTSRLPCLVLLKPAFISPRTIIPDLLMSRYVLSPKKNARQREPCLAFSLALRDVFYVCYAF